MKSLIICLIILLSGCAFTPTEIYNNTGSELKITDTTTLQDGETYVTNRDYAQHLSDDWDDVEWVGDEVHVYTVYTHLTIKVEMVEKEK